MMELISHSSQTQSVVRRLEYSVTLIGYYRVAKNVGRLGLDWFGPGESGWTRDRKSVV